jgi:hypothetical protein
VLLSVRQTCSYRGVSFLRFLLSQEGDVAAFSECGGGREAASLLEVYPDGFSPSFRKMKGVTRSDKASAASATEG